MPINYLPLVSLRFSFQEEIIRLLHSWSKRYSRTRIFLRYRQFLQWPSHLIFWTPLFQLSNLRISQTFCILNTPLMLGPSLRPKLTDTLVPLASCSCLSTRRTDQFNCASGLPACFFSPSSPPRQKLSWSKISPPLQLPYLCLMSFMT